MAYVIPTVHPAHLLRGAPLTDVVAADLRKAVRISSCGPTQIENIVIAHPASPVGMEQSVRFVLSWMDTWIAKRCPVAVDIETSGIDFTSCDLFSIALSGEDGHNTAVSFTLEDFHTLTLEAESALVRKLRELLLDPNVPLIMHNKPFDSAVLIRKGYGLRGFIYDTQGLAHLVQPDIPKDLGFIGHQYLDVEPWKLNHEGKKVAQTNDVLELLVYNAKDALNTMKCKHPLVEEIHSRGMNDRLIQYQMAYGELATRMELRGIPVNMRKRQALGDKLLADMEGWLHSMRSYLNWPDFNPNKPSHSRVALFTQKYCGLAPTKFTPQEQAPSTSYKAIIDHLEHPFVRDFVSYIEARTTHSTQFKNPMNGKPGGSFWQNIIWDGVSEWGRLFPKWNPTGQKGARFSSSPNVQNIAYEYRHVLETPPGYVLVGADKDQLELRVIACNAGVEELIRELRMPGADPHTLAARNIYAGEFDQRTPEERANLRKMVKNVVYASLYLAGPNTVYRTLREKKDLDPAMRAAMTLGVVTHIHRSYFGRYVEIPAYHQANIRKATTEGFIECNPLGRRRYFPVQPPPATEIGNWPTQTEGADHVTIEMVHCQEEFDRHPDWDACVICHGHDAIYSECKEQYGENVREVTDHFFGKTRIEGPRGEVFLTAKANIGRNFYECK
jgi:DNA polymerase I-like protein with 3'-5' exonuclease and polymerase domains